ncbi:MAG: hypothetical protein EHM41_04555 [Chloroflexi bacterium]|nr:MAG: hypothetical protein EHM41_04555 [Chloroflexota bacterium]
MFLILLVLDNPELVEDLLDAWEEAGVTGATILHSTGLGRLRKGDGLRDDVPLMPSLESLLDHVESFSRTIFTVVNDEAKVDGIVRATQSITGDLSLPNSGFMIVVPVARVYGLQNRMP